nr:uncharacterized protein LOC113818709 [Penaeus vannamei]
MACDEGGGLPCVPSAYLPCFALFPSRFCFPDHVHPEGTEPRRRRSVAKGVASPWKPGHVAAAAIAVAAIARHTLRTVVHVGLVLAFSEISTPEAEIGQEGKQYRQRPHKDHTLSLHYPLKSPALTTSSRWAAVAARRGGGGGGSVRGVAGEDDAAPGVSQEASGPQHATVVRTESHLARFNTARALFEKMGQSEGGIGQPPRAAPASAALSARVPPPAGFGGKVGAGLAKGEGEAKKAGAAVSRRGAPRRPRLSRRPRRVAFARAVPGRRLRLVLALRLPQPRPHQRTRPPQRPGQRRGRVRGRAGGGPGENSWVALAGLRRPGSSSSRSLSTSSTESEPTPRRWPPHAASSGGRARTPPRLALVLVGRRALAPETFKSDLTAELRRAARPEKPEKPAKPESLDRRASTHEQHQELIARHKNWFQSFSKSRSSPTASPSKPDYRPTSPSKAAEWEQRPPSPSKADGRGLQPSKTDLRSPRGAETNEEAAMAEKKEEEGRGGGGGGGGGKGLVSEQDAWSSVLQSRYGTKAKDILSPRARSEGDTTADWRKERAAILSGELQNCLFT